MASNKTPAIGHFDMSRRCGSAGMGLNCECIAAMRLCGGVGTAATSGTSCGGIPSAMKSDET